MRAAVRIASHRVPPSSDDAPMWWRRSRWSGTGGHGVGGGDGADRSGVVAGGGVLHRVWAAEVGTEVRLLRATQAELAGHAQERETAYRYTDLGGLARTLPGVAEVSGPVLVAGMGRPGRFPTGAAFKSYTGLAPRASETGNTDRKSNR